MQTPVSPLTIRSKMAPIRSRSPGLDEERKRAIANNRSRRRYVIRVRAEDDQFLLCCIELGTFVKWLECLFAAIDVAAPIDDRDFPRDMSIPRIQRIRWYRGLSPVRMNPEAESRETAADEETVAVDDEDEEAVATSTISQSPTRGRRSSTPDPLPAPELLTMEVRESVDDEYAHSEPEAERGSLDVSGPLAQAPHRIEPPHRLSTSSYPHPAIDPHSGKWFPEHNWSSAHDLLYAKLCYSNLLFRSPRKSNYIISKGKQWYVDWESGRMVRVLPPGYGEVNDWMGPWQFVHTENRRI